jgi:CHAT domain-containing protein/tetratricopeptide (TPR) repeat protein
VLVLVLAISFQASSQSTSSLDAQIAQGQAAYDRADYTGALAAFEPALVQLRATKSKALLADLAFKVGTADFWLNRPDRALAAFREALAIHRELKNRFGEANDLGGIGIEELTLSHYDDALSSYQQALAIDREIKNRLGEANALRSIGTVEENLGRYGDAVSSYQQAVAIYRELKDASSVGFTLIGIANLDVKLGRYDDALRANQERLANDRESTNKYGKASAAGDLIDIGFLDETLGRYDDALKSFQDALAIDREIKDRDAEAKALIDVGSAEDQLGRNVDALESVQQALDILSTIDDPYAFASAASVGGTVAMRAGIYDKALWFYQLALATQRRLKNPTGEAYASANVGAVEILLGQYKEALAHAQRAVLLDRQRQLPGLTARDPSGFVYELRTAANAESHLELRDAALADYDGALAQIESLRAGLTQGERSSFFSKTLFVYDEYIAYLLQLDGRFPGKGYDRKALEIFERKSARAILEQVGESAAEHFRGVPADVAASEREAGVASDRAESTLSKLLSTAGSDQTAIASAERSLAAAKGRIATLEASIKVHYPAYYGLRHPEPLVAQCAQTPCSSIAGFQRSVLRPGELMLVYDLLAKQSALWLIERDRVHLIPLAGSAEIARAVTRIGTHVDAMLGLLHQGMPSRLERGARNDLPEFAADSHALYRLLIPDAAAAAIARAKNLIVVPSGSLYRLAFETLVTKDPAPEAQPHYLIEDVPVSYIPSASLLAVVRASYGQPRAGRKPLLAFANPTFGAVSGEGARGLSTDAGLQLAAARSAFAGEAGAASVNATVFPALPGSQTEADAVRVTLGAPPASLVTGDDATRQRVLDLNASDSLKTYRYLLFATHAVLPNQIAGLAQPAIVMAHPERGDGLLTMADVFGLSLDADFVTLSACNTGVATAGSGGDGISGLTRAFLYAGTPALSVTLWEVDDAAAPQVTPPFFASMHAGTSPAEALREAKLALLKSPEARFRHPYAWGPSVIFGDGGLREDGTRRNH